MPALHPPEVEMDPKMAQKYEEEILVRCMFQCNFIILCTETVFLCVVFSFQAAQQVSLPDEADEDL